ncbi:MAG: tannase/feruloyl esterase family alpha/beta hydrolase, partial [Burkholderiales bacterium]|nr:tannase/feruloyl esterase family alpha/beta hydrolase [Burkholderiales bacterium]
MPNPAWFAVAAAALLAGCAAPPSAPAPQLAAARPAKLLRCAALAQDFDFGRTKIDSAAVVAAGTLSVGDHPIAEHCLVSGRMNERTSPVDGQSYAIAFQMRLPQDWNGRFFHQGNGGLDGFVQPAVGLVGGGGELSNALAQGFAVLSSDGGHNVRQLPMFGRDPQARLDYGYQAVAALTPMARALIAAAYGKVPDRSYFGGCSHGGRHTMVAASRSAADYDGYLVGDPGFNLPKAAVAQLYGAR